MILLRKFLCNIFRYCPEEFNKQDDPLFKRYAEIDRRVDELYWKPRDLLDLR